MNRLLSLVAKLSLELVAKIAVPPAKPISTKPSYPQNYPRGGRSA